MLVTITIFIEEVTFQDANEDQVGNATVSQHKAGFKAMAM